MYSTSEMKLYRWAELKRGIRDAFPVIIGLVPLALVLGAQASKKGMSTVEVSLMTALNYAGGSEFAAIELWSSPPNIAVIVAMTFLINSRHIVMGATLAPLLKHLPFRKTLPALFFMCDESWAMGVADARGSSRFQPFSFHYYLGVALLLWFNWVAFTSLGALIGPALTDIRAWGFDMAFPAVFLVLLRGMWKGLKFALPWLVSLLIACGSWLWLPQGWFVPTGALGGLLVAYLLGGDR
ncbi:AzlC family ABC transporter permease [Salinicola halophyticus]|uniref:AzlC family ABC transporter permease n=1 Tax=Salinicola halophyticus TaxID=1808881 RepID=UPI000DA13F05|nr:AzlC family ABC transporter permease [Salinicola halophyticus]